MVHLLSHREEWVLDGVHNLLLFVAERRREVSIPTLFWDLIRLCYGAFGHGGILYSRECLLSDKLISFLWWL